MKKIGIIGCGRRITFVLKVIAGLNKDLEVAAIYDPDESQMDTLNENLGINAKKTNSLEEFLAIDDIPWVMIGSYNALHANHIIESFKAGKNVFCEKPIATDIDDCKRIIKAHEVYGKQFMLGFTLRYSSHYRIIKDLIDSGMIGNIVSMEFNENITFDHGGHIRCCWRGQKKYTGTHLLEKCCHDIDIANWMVGSSKAKCVASFGGINFFCPENETRLSELKKNQNGQPAYCGRKTAHNKNPFTIESDVVDNQVAIIEYENQVRATFHTNLNAAIPERRLYILGTHGAVRSDLMAGTIEF